MLNYFGVILLGVAPFLLWNFFVSFIPLTKQEVQSKKEAKQLSECLEKAQKLYFNAFNDITSRYDSRLITNGEQDKAFENLDLYDKQLNADCLSRYSEAYRKVLKMQEEYDKTYKPRDK